MRSVAVSFVVLAVLATGCSSAATDSGSAEGGQSPTPSNAPPESTTTASVEEVPESTIASTTSAVDDESATSPDEASEIGLVILEASVATKQSLGDEWWARSGVAVANSSDGVGSAEISVTVFDADGNPLDTDTLRISHIPPGGVGYGSADHLDTGVEVASVEAFLLSDDAGFSSRPTPIAVEAATVEVEDRSVDVRATLTNPTDNILERSDIWVSCGVYHAGELVLVVDGVGDDMPPAATVAWDRTEFTPVAAADSVDCVAAVRE